MNKFLRVMRETGGKGATGWKDGRALLADPLDLTPRRGLVYDAKRGVIYYVLSEGGL